MASITIRRPDDWHLHLRDGDIMRAVLPYTAAVFGRAIVMPNLIPPVTTKETAIAYRNRILKALPPGHRFEPLMTYYLTDATDDDDLREGFEEGVFAAAKLYPAGATTNSESGVTSVERIYPILETMQKLGMPLLVHGEVVDSDVDVFDREAVFIDRVLDPLRKDLPDLRIVFEHVTTAEAVDYVQANSEGLGATITPHHLVINRNSMFRGGLRPHMYCLPVAKRENHRLALRAAATSADHRFFLGTDSAPHPSRDKESDCGCAGIFNAPTAMSCLAQIFDEENALGCLEAFTSLNGARFYGLPVNDDTVTLTKAAEPIANPDPVSIADDEIRVFAPMAPNYWVVEVDDEAQLVNDAGLTSRSATSV
ncbi:MAG: dihydroorotase [Alphaproteobacteria bacterium]|nr:dihydroorotase [Alphaproteobacteria bacterium]